VGVTITTIMDIDVGRLEPLEIDFPKLDIDFPDLSEIDFPALPEWGFPEFAKTLLIERESVFPSELLFPLRVGRGFVEERPRSGPIESGA